MGVTKDFIMATIADAMTPTFRRPMEDLIYETLDRRQIPTRTDFKELRDLVNNLRGQVSGSVQSVRSLHNALEEIEESLDEKTGENMTTLVPDLEERLQTIETMLKGLSENAVLNRIQELESKMEAHQNLLEKITELEENQKIILKAIRK